MYKLFSIAKILGTFATLQVFAQGAQMLTAILVIRTLPKEEYAWYSMVIALQGAMVVFSSSGLSPGMMAMGGPVAKDRENLGRVIVSSLRLRWILGITGGLVGIPAYAYLLHRNGCPSSTLVVMLLIAGLMLLQTIRLEIFNFALNINARYSLPQIGNLALHVGRGLLISLYAFIAKGDPIVYLAISLCVGFFIIEYYLSRQARIHADLSQPSDPEYETRYKSFMANGILPSVSSIFQTQLGTVLIATFGTISSVADLGALTRLGLITAIPMAMIQSILIPRIANQPSQERALAVWVSALFLSITGCSGFVLAAYLLKDYVYLILGRSYTGVSEFIPIFSVYLSLTVIITTFGSILKSRGWLKHSWMRPIATISAQAMAIPFLDLSTIPGVIYLSCCGGIGFFSFELILLLRGIRGVGSI